MAKAIKFNLTVDGKPIRDLGDLRNNFNVEDILGIYENGSLKRWLDVRGMEKESFELDKISGDTVQIATELCRIFHAEENFTAEQIKLAAYPFEFRMQEEERLRNYLDMKKQRNEIIDAYHAGYNKLLADLEERSGDYFFIKSALAELYKNYPALYRIDAEAFYARFIKKHPLVILGMLANSDMRPLIARQPEQVYADLKIWKLVIVSNALRTEIIAPLRGHVKDFVERTDWKDIKPKGKHFMIIAMGPGSFVRSTGNKEEELKAEDVNGKFPILDGIEYKSDNALHWLVYMEV